MTTSAVPGERSCVSIPMDGSRSCHDDPVRIVEPSGLMAAAPVRAGYSVLGVACERCPPWADGSNQARRGDQEAAQGSSEYHDGGVSAMVPDHEPEGDDAWWARPSNEMTGRIRLASHSPPATVRWTPSPHRACTPSTVTL